MAEVPPSEADLPAVEGFLKTVLRSGLMDRANCKKHCAMSRSISARPRALADHLVRKGKLSRFQAGKILRGTGRGLLLGHFQVLAPIRRGGMSTVYLARDERSGQLVALKLLPPSRWVNEERILIRFQREMELSRRVAHPHLAWTYESGLFQRIYYIAMEYIPGQNLSRVVASGGPLRPARAARLMAEVASALEHAHNQGLIHRDLKPSNIMVTPNDHAKVLDLGLALMQGEQADQRVIGGQGYIVGTMDYIAPEQTTDAAGVDRRSDIYSLGCTLYFALSGQPPFPGGTGREKVRRHRREEPAPLLELAPSVPPGLARFIGQMMAKDRDARPSSAAAVEEELRSWASGDPSLPLDRHGDEHYEESIAVLQTADGLTDYSLPGTSTAEVDLSAENEEAAGAAASRRSIRKALLLAVLLVFGGVSVIVLLALWLWGAS